MTGDKTAPYWNQWNRDSWQENDVEELRKFWDEGLSAGMIGIRMKRTRNAVIGKVHRLGLTKRASLVKAPRRGATHILKSKKPGHRQTNYNFAFGGVAKKHKPPKIEAHVIPKLDDIVPVNGTGITIFDLRKEVCHAVISMPDRRSNELARYCGHEVYDGRYCEGHYVAFHALPRPR